jgi:quercetin dioxygenase-like cupin family protein
MREEPPAMWVVAAPGTQMRRMVEGEGASIILYRIEPGTEFEPHSHPFAELGVVLAGEGTFTVGPQHRLLREGDSFFIPGDTLHGFRVPKGTQPVVMLNVSVSVPNDLSDASASTVIRLAESIAKRETSDPTESR